jgi:hypothetical protein
VQPYATFFFFRHIIGHLHNAKQLDSQHSVGIFRNILEFVRTLQPLYICPMNLSGTIPSIVSFGCITGCIGPFGSIRCRTVNVFDQGENNRGWHLKPPRQKSWQGFEEVTVWYSEVVLITAS